jgi:hypothetical protein
VRLSASSSVRRLAEGHRSQMNIGERGAAIIGDVRYDRVPPRSGEPHTRSSYAWRTRGRTASTRELTERRSSRRPSGRRLRDGRGVARRLAEPRTLGPRRYARRCSHDRGPSTNASPSPDHRNRLPHPGGIRPPRLHPRLGSACAHAAALGAVDAVVAGISASAVITLGTCREHRP